MTTYQKVLKNLNVQSAEAFKQDVETTSTYYVFTANCVPLSGPTTPIDSVESGYTTYDSMLFGNRIKSTDLRLVVPRVNWTINTVYDIYDPSDTSLYTKQFFVMVTEGTNYYVYKCLDNNGGSPSLVQPFGTDSTPLYSVLDGYVWKYLYTLTDFDVRTFATDQYIPVNIEQNGLSSTVGGGIEVITVDPTNSGSGYNNYTLGAFSDSNSITYNNDSNQYLLNSSASNISGFYNNCLMKVISLDTNLSQYALITNYTVVGSNKIVYLSSPFMITPKAGDLYEIYPNVLVQDLNATSTSQCQARAIISANTGNSVSKVEVINPGANYRKALAYINVNGSVGVTSNASLNAIVSPVAGHGSDLATELFAYRIVLSTTFTSNNGVLLTDNGYGTIGILKNPSYSNVSVILNTNTIIGSVFTSGEEVYRYKSYTLAGNVSVVSGNTRIISDSSTFGSSLRVDDQIIVTNGSQNLYANVNSIIDTNTVVLDQELPFTSNNCTVNILQTSSFGIVKSYDLNTTLTLTNVTPSNLDSSTRNLVGTISNCTAEIDSTVSPYLLINGRNAENFSQFSQLTKLTGTINSNIFINNEVLVQDSIQTMTSPSAVLFSAHVNGGIGTDVLYVTKTNNILSLSNPIIGSTSGGSFSPQYKYDGDLIVDSGDIVYLENLNYVTRNLDQSETIKLILEF